MIISSKKLALLFWIKLTILTKDFGDFGLSLATSFIIADYLTLPISSTMLYFALKGKKPFRLPYTIPAELLVKDHSFNTPRLVFPVLSIASTRPVALTFRLQQLASRKIVFSPKGTLAIRETQETGCLGDPLKFAIGAPLLVPLVNKSMTMPIQILLALMLTVYFQQNGTFASSNK